MSNTFGPPEEIKRPTVTPATAYLQAPTANPYKQQPSNEKKKSKLIPILITGLVTISLGASALAYTSVNRYNELLESSNDQIDKANVTIAELQKDVNTLQEDNKNKTDLLNERESYAVALDDYKAAVGSVSGSFDTDETTAKVEASINIVKQEVSDPNNVKAERDKLKAYTTEIYNSLAAYKEAQSQAEKAVESGIGTNPRKAMDAIDPTITLTVVDLACNGERAMACVASSNPKNVQVTRDYVGYSYEAWYMVMMHEYAHTKQFGNYTDFRNSERIKTLFNSDAELHADCMAQFKIGASYVSNYGNTCSPEQVAAAGEAWNGVF